MGLIIRSNVDASQYASKLMSQVTNGLVLLALQDTSRDKALKDFGMKSNAAMNVVGNPTFSAHDGTQFKALQNYIQTDVMEPDDVTIFCVYRGTVPYSQQGDAQNQLAVMGNYQTAGGYQGIAFGFASGTNLTSHRVGRCYKSSESPNGLVVSGTLRSSLQPAGSGSVGTEYRVHGVRMPANGQNCFSRDYTAGGTASATWSVTGDNIQVLKNPSPLRIGSFNAGQQGGCMVTQLRIYNRLLSDVEMETVVAEMRSYEMLMNNRVV